MAARRTEWISSQCDVDPTRLRLIDETWVTTNPARPRRRRQRGQRLLNKVPHGHWKTTTFPAALRCGSLTALLVVDGAITGSIFRKWVEQKLVPTLKANDIVIVDRLSCHRMAGAREAIAPMGARMPYLAPYNPDLNPIENVFSKFTWLIHCRKERTVETL